MSTNNDGGSAFPAQPRYQMPHGVELVTEQGGMTLRDYFAAKAMGHHIAGSTWDDLRDGAEELAEMAYRIADAMLEARKQ